MLVKGASSSLHPRIFTTFAGESSLVRSARPLHLLFHYNPVHFVTDITENKGRTVIPRFAALPFNSSDHSLPPNTENTESVPFNQIVTLFHSSTALESPFHCLMADIADEKGRPLICIIAMTFSTAGLQKLPRGLIQSTSTPSHLH